MDKGIEKLEIFQNKSEEAQRKSVEAAQEAEEAKEDLARVEQEVEQAELQVTEASVTVRTSTEADGVVKKEENDARDRLKTAIKQWEETGKLANKAKTEVERTSKKYETLKIKTENKSGDEKAVRALEQARQDFEEAQRKSVEAAQEVEKVKEELARVEEEVKQVELRVTEAAVVVETSINAEIAAKKAAAQARERLKTVIKQSEETVKLANKAKNQAEQASKKFETKRQKEENKETKIAEVVEEDQVGPTISTEEYHALSNELYQGKIKIQIKRPVMRSSLRELERSLAQDTDNTVTSIGGSIEEGACIFIHVNQPSSLENRLAEFPIIESLTTDKKDMRVILKNA